MSDDLVAVVRRQIGPTLAMLRAAIEACPDEVWAQREASAMAPGEHAYHALLGLAIWLAWPGPRVAFPAFHREGEGEGPTDLAPHPRPTIAAYADEVAAGVESFLDRLTPGNALDAIEVRGRRFTRLDLVLSQIRHVQHHVGCVHAHLRRRTGDAPAWLGYGEG